MSDPSPTAGLSSKYLGRRLRPWWGQRPSRLVARGLIGLVLFGILTFKALEFATDTTAIADLAENLDWPNGRVRLVALIGSGLLGLAAVHGLVSLVVGIIDVVTRRTIEGRIVSARRRHPGDWLPKPVQMILRFRNRRRRGLHHSRSYDRRVRHEIVVETGSGHQAWNTEPRRFDAGLQNRRVRLTVTPLIGYVREIEALEPAPSPAGARPFAAADPAGPAADHGDADGPAGTPVGPPAAAPPPNADVLSEIPGYEHYRGSRNRIPGLGQLEQIPGMRGILDRIPGADKIPGLGGSGDVGTTGHPGTPDAIGSGDVGDLTDAPPVSAPHPAPPVPGDPRPPMPPGPPPVPTPPGPPPSPGPVPPPIPEPPPVPQPPPTPQPPTPPGPPTPQPPPLPPTPEPGPDPTAPDG